MTIALEQMLAKAGLRVDPDEFLSLVEDAARRFITPHPDPAGYFTSDQRDALQDVGLDLSPRRPDETDGRARAVAEQAVLRDSALTVSEAARTIGVDNSRIRHRLAAGRLMGWKDRGWYLGAHASTLFDRNGNAGPTVWWDGRVVGGWSQRRDGEIAVGLLEDVGADARAAIDAEAARLRDWLGDARFSPGFLPPFQRELATPR